MKKLSAKTTKTAAKTPAKAAPKAPAKRSVGRPRKAAAKAADDTRLVTFTISAAAGLPVYVAGTFNDWAAEDIALAEKDGVYTATVPLKPGEYEYKFIVNGFWTMDPDPAREWRANGLGTLNSVIVVQ